MACPMGADDKERTGQLVLGFEAAKQMTALLPIPPPPQSMLKVKISI